jgi:biotin carboxyl carrier protein
MCCGQKRATMASQGAAHRAAGPPQQASRAIGQTVRLRYLQPTGATIRGPVSGRVYEFSGPGAVFVDPGDAVALQQTGFFERLVE